MDLLRNHLMYVYLISIVLGVKTLFKMGLILIKISLQEKSYSSLKKRFPTMCETLEALRNPPVHLLEEERIIKKVIFFFIIVLSIYNNI